MKFKITRLVLIPLVFAFRAEIISVDDFIIDELRLVFDLERAIDE